MKEISGINTDSFVNLNNLRTIPQARFSNLIVRTDAEITTVKNTNFKYFLKNRFLKNSPQNQILNGIYYFDNLEIKGKCQLSIILIEV